MKALTFAGKGRVSYESVDDPRIVQPHDAIVQVRAAGICGSDLHPFHEREKGLDHGAVMGHEFVGEVVEVGSDVRDFAPGDIVFSPFTTSCGDCYYCRRGLTCRCTRGELFGWVHEGEGLHGAQAEYVRVPIADGTLMRIPEGVSDAAGLLLGDILSTGFFCAEQAGIGTIDDKGHLGPVAAAAGGTFAVVGCGPVGLMTIVAARHLGAEELFAIDTIPARLALAEELGAIPLDFKADPVAEIVAEATDGRGVDAAMEVVGGAVGYCHGDRHPSPRRNAVVGGCAHRRTSRLLPRRRRTTRT